MCTKYLELANYSEEAPKMDSVIEFLEKAADLLPNENVKEIVEKICRSELLQTQAVTTFVREAEQDSLDQLIHLCFNENFIWVQSPVKQSNANKLAKGGLSFEITDAKQANKFAFNKKEEKVEEEPVEPQPTNVIAERVFSMFKGRVTENQDIAKIQLAMMHLEDELAQYVIVAVRNDELFRDMVSMFRTLLTEVTEHSETYRTFIFEQLSTMCALEVSMQQEEQPSLDRQFVEGILTLAILAPFKQGGGEQPLLTFLKQDVIGQQFKDHRTRLYVLDLFCQLGQSMFDTENEQTRLYEKIVQNERAKAMQEDLEETQEKEQGQVDEGSAGSDEDEALTGQRKEEKVPSNKEFLGYRADEYTEDDTKFAEHMAVPEDKCTFYRTSKNFEQQHWYVCYTCPNMQGGNGACSVCVRKCHAGHHVAYAKKSSFYCDCAPSGSCKIYNPQAKPDEKKNDGPSMFGGAQGGLFSNTFNAKGPPPPIFGGAMERDLSPSYRDRPLGNSLFGGQFPPSRGPGLGKVPVTKYEAPAFDQRAPPQFSRRQESRLEEFSLPPGTFQQQIGFNQLMQDKEQLVQQQMLREVGQLTGDRNPNNVYDPSQSLFGAGNAPIKFGQNPLSGFVNEPDKDNEGSIEIEQEINFIEQEMLEAGNSFGEIKEYIERLRSRSRGLLMERSNRQEDQDKFDEEEDDSDQDDYESKQSCSDKSHGTVKESQDGGADLDMSQNVALSFAAHSETKWGVMSASDSEQSQNDFLRIKKMKRLAAQQQRYNKLQTVVGSVQPMIEQVLEKVYLKLDQITENGTLEQPQPEDTQMLDSSLQSPLKTTASLLSSPLSKVECTQGGVSFRRLIKPDSFKVKMSGRQSMQLIAKNMALRQCASAAYGIDVVCVVENEDVKFYRSGNFKKDNKAMQASDVQKLPFTPISAHFNEWCSNFVAIAGSNSLVVLTVDKEGKVLSELTVNLMLEAYGDQLSIIGTKWVPGTKTVLAVATQNFIRVYDLAKDNFSPIYNISTFSGSIVDFTFSKNVTADDSETRILVATSGKKVFMQPLEIPSDTQMQVDQGRNSEITLTEEIPLSPLTSPITSLSYLPTSKLLILSLDSGTVHFCQLEADQNKVECQQTLTELDKCCVKNGKLQQLQANGSKFSRFVELPGTADSVNMVALYHKEEAGMAVVLKLVSGRVLLTPLWQSKSDKVHQFPAIQGCVLIPSKKQGLRMVTFQQDGSAHTFNFDGTGGVHLRNKEAGGAPKANVEDAKRFQKVLMHELPKKVGQMPANFFEKLVNVYAVDNLRSNMNVNGNMQSLIRGSSRIFESHSSNEPVINESSQKQLRLQLKLDSKSEHLIVGIRVRMDGGRDNPSKIAVKIMNRNNFVLYSRGPFWYDFPLCDAEIISVQQSALQIAFCSEDPKHSPLRIYCIELFAKSNQQFQLHEKISSHEKCLQKDALKQKRLNSVMVGTEHQLGQELAQTNRVPLLTYREKLRIMKDKTDSQLELILELDIIQQILLSNAQSITPQLQATLTKLTDKLTEAYRKQVMVNLLTDSEKDPMFSAIHRSLKVVLMLQKNKTESGDPQNFSTLKDKVRLDIIIKALMSEDKDVDFATLKRYLHMMAQLFSRRFHQFFSLLDEVLPENMGIPLIKKVTSSYLKQIGQEKEDGRAINDLIILNFAIFTYYVNKVTQTNTTKTGARQLITDVYTNEFKKPDSILKQAILPIQTLILHRGNDSNTKQIIRCLRRASSQYQEAMRRSIALDQFVTAPQFSKVQNKTVEMRFLFVDLMPFLIQNLLLKVILKEQSHADMAFKIAYLSIVGYFKEENSSFPSQPLFDILKEFVLSQITIDFSRAEHKQLYASLSMLNLLFLVPAALNKVGPAQKKTTSFEQFSKRGGIISLKQENANLFGGSTETEGLSPTVHKMMLKCFLQDKDFAEKVTQWAANALTQIQQEFKDGLCSLRTKVEENVKVGTLDHLSEANNNAAQGVALLKPVVESGTWRWAPVLPMSDELFELLDRKVVSSILVFTQLILCPMYAIKENQPESETIEKLVMSIANISHSSPTNALFAQFGGQCVEQLMRATNLFVACKNYYKNQALFRENVSELHTIYEICGDAASIVSYKVQFHLHELLVQIQETAKESPQMWQDFLRQSGKKSETVLMMVNLAHSLCEESAALCLSLAAMAFGKTTEDKQNVVSEVDEAIVKVVVKDLDRLIDLYLIGTNRKTIRNEALFFFKGIYETNLVNKELLNGLVKRLGSLKTQGINSSQFTNLLACIVVGEAKKGDLAKETLCKITQGIYQMIVECNNQITSHANLDIYACLQRVTGSFQSKTQDPSTMQKISYHAYIQHQQQQHQQNMYGQSLQMSRKPIIPMASSSSQQTPSRSNSYILEMEPCSKCFEAKSAPSKTLRWNEIKSDQKFTDSAIIMKLNSTYRIDGFSFCLKEAAGFKAIKGVNFYVNTIQGMDLAEMKNNWAIWKKVQHIKVDYEEHPFPYNWKVNVPLPVTASNILIEFQTVNLSRQVQKGGGPGLSADASLAKQGSKDLDKALGLLPEELQSKLSMSKVSKACGHSGADSGSGGFNEMVICPRCSRQVTNGMGICACGENALYCPYCRNINYEKPDSFMCKDCGKTRYAQFDFQFTVKDGAAYADTIETEDAKKGAEEQIETNLKKAQDCYTRLMTMRNHIQNHVKKINEGQNAGQTTAQLQSQFSNDCLEQYKAMMKSLSTIKAYKIEIDKFTKSAVKEQKKEVEKLPFQSLGAEDDEEEHKLNSCFACVQKLLISSLQFISRTSQYSEDLKQKFRELGQAEVIYDQNLRMYSETIQVQSRTALCALLSQDPTGTNKLLVKIEADLDSKQAVIPAHMLLTNLTQESQLLIKLIDQAKQEKNRQADVTFWRVLFSSLEKSENSSAIAEAVCQPILAKLKQKVQVEVSKQNLEQKVDSNLPLTSVMFTANEETMPLVSMMVRYIKYAQDASSGDFTFVEGEESPSKMWLMGALLMKSSLSVQQEASQIIKILLNEEGLKDHMTEMLLSQLDQALNNEPMAAEQYFALLTTILAIQPKKAAAQQLSLANNSQRIRNERKRDASPLPQKKEEIPEAEEEVSDATCRHFETVFSKVDSELTKLLVQEQERLALGHEGFMPTLSAGQNLCRIVAIASQMMKGRAKLIEIVKKNIFVIIKSSLKLKKLNLMKNKQVRNCEDQIQGIFEQLHSDRIEDKENLIRECLRLIESGTCDLKECRFLVEDICKIVLPVKPEVEYFCQLVKARSNEEFIPGKMSRNPYSSKAFGGKLMDDMRNKITRDCELGDPTLIELVIAGKLVEMHLPIIAVFEQVWWPFVFKQKNPDQYEIPPITPEDVLNIPPMTVTFRLIGIDGEATEPRVENLPDQTEPTTEAEIQKKYGLASVISEKLGALTGVEVMLNMLDSIENLNQANKDLVSWLVHLIGLAIKLKSNRIEFLKHDRIIDVIASKLFQSVGMHSKFDGKNEQSLFEIILHILEKLILEMELSSEHLVVQDNMEVDQEKESQESDAQAHVEMFLNLIQDACSEMIESSQSIDKTSNKIKAMSKVLPHLIKIQDRDALTMLVTVLTQYLSVENVDQIELKKQAQSDQFTAKFYLERITEIFEAIHPHKAFIKDEICDQPNVAQLFEYMSNQKLFVEPSVETAENLDTNLILLNLVKGLIKGHKKSQALLEKYGLVKAIYQLSTQKFKDNKPVLLSYSIIKILQTDKYGDPATKSFIESTLSAKKKQQAQKAALAKSRTQKRFQMKPSPFLKKMSEMKEETGPKCVTCEDGYLTKPAEILGLYVFSKKQHHLEWSDSSRAVHQVPGYTTVTHNNYIHFTCHQTAAKNDYENKKRIKEWDGATIRNQHTNCNNLLPVRGGAIDEKSFANVIDRYFEYQRKQFGNVDPNRVKVLSHDLKSLLKRFACQESFNRDSKGGGPESNMNLVPLIVSMITHCLKNNYGQSQSNFIIVHEKTAADKDLVFVQEKSLQEFLKQGVSQREAFLTRLEEEEKVSEEDMMEKGSEYDDEEDESDFKPEHKGPSSDEQKQFDQIHYFMSQSLMFAGHKTWHQTKISFITIAICAIASMKRSEQPSASAFAFRVSAAEQKKEEVDLKIPSPILVRKRSLSDVSKLDQVLDNIQELKPMLVMLSLVDMIKEKWDVDRLALPTSTDDLDCAAYLQRLTDSYLVKDNVKDVADDCQTLYDLYNKRVLKIDSIEGFMEQLKLKEQVVAEFGSVDQFVASHF